ncbi:hypothetical protein ACFFHI_25620 [Streptomyces palmae]|uniref:YunG family protein n=1 Tax=Streptomyces palmae TaxID=1701085 RepID=UPI0035EA1AC1
MLRSVGTGGAPDGAAPWTLAAVEEAIRSSWAADTCSPDDAARAPWTPQNPAWGHCDITALVVHDLLGGQLVVGEVYLGEEQHGHHWWNRLPSGIELDLTQDQFRRGQVVTGRRLVERPPGRLPHHWEEYLLLRGRVGAKLPGLGGVPEESEEGMEG